MTGAAQIQAADIPETVGRGATRDEVIAAFGPPTGRSKWGNVEVLHFGTRQVRLEDGRVVRVTSKEPKPAPVAAVASASGATESNSPLARVWITNFEESLHEAARRNTAVVALFTSSDASPASRQFQKEIVLHPEFVNAFRAQYVLLRVDFPVRGQLAPDLHTQNAELRERYGIRSLPAIMVLSATGERLAGVEIPESTPGSAARARLIADVAAAYDLPPPPAPPVPAPSPEPVLAAAPAPAPAVGPDAAQQVAPVAPPQVTSGLTIARWLIIVGIAAGSLLAALMLLVLWLVIRKINKPVALTRRSTMATRISQAASGLPTFAEIRGWQKETLCHVLIGLATAEGYVAIEQREDSEKDLVLKRPGQREPEIIVCCVTGNAGIIPTRRIREMLDILAAEKVAAGWFVSPMGFSVDARAYAEQNNIRLIDASVLLELLSNLPSFALPKVLTARHSNGSGSLYAEPSGELA